MTNQIQCIILMFDNYYTYPTKLQQKMGDRYFNVLKENESSISKNVTSNLFKKHVMLLFMK